jgi:predicted nucleic acid-binding protein
VLFDTDIFIWVQRGHERASQWIEDEAERYLSLQTYLELLQGATDKNQQKWVKGFLSDFSFVILPLTENIGHRAAIYIEEYGLSSGLRAGDAIIAATAVENNLKFATSNGKHFKRMVDLEICVFKP